MSAAPRQLALDFAPRAALGRDDLLVSAANAEAVALVEGWRGWPGGRLAVIGPAAAGKTHLAHVWMAETGATSIAASDLAEEAVPALVAAGAVVVEDADRLALLSPARRDAAEAAFFHLYNLIAAEGGRLMVTGRGAPATWQVATRDLASRLQSLAVARIGEPDDALLSAVLVKLFADRQLQVGPEVVKYLSERIDRSFAAAGTAVAELDALSLTLGRPITRQLAARWLENEGRGSGD